MLKFVSLLCTAILFSASPALSANANSQSQAAYFSQILNNICSIGPCQERPNPYTTEGAEDIIGNAIILASFDNSKKIEALNKPLRGMGLEYTNLIPGFMVADAVCKYYGFNLGKYEQLENAAFRKQIGNEFYVLTPGDPGIVEFEVKQISKLKNGLLKVSGINVEGDDTPFIAYFKPSNCQNSPHWVLLKMIYPIPDEESDGFTMPEDK